MCNTKQAGEVDHGTQQCNVLPKPIKLTELTGKEIHSQLADIGRCYLPTDCRKDSKGKDWLIAILYRVTALQNPT